MRAPLRSLLILALLATGPTRALAAPVLVLTGRGVQIYRCVGPTGHASAAAWTLLGPEATLFTEAGQLAGHHFAGPTWQATDGSTVVGEIVAAGGAPFIGAVPWLVLRAKSHAGAGVFARVTIVTRARTEGGTAPATGCDPAHLGALARVPYTATYAFFSP